MRYSVTKPGRTGLIGLTAVLLASCASMGGMSGSGKAVIGGWGFDIAGMDQSVKPGDDFDAYVNGTWKKNTQIPADRSRWGSFDRLGDEADANVRAIIEETAAAQNKPGSIAEKIGNAYNAFMDTAAIEAAGLAPLSADLQAIKDAKSGAEIAALMRRAESGAGGPINIGVGLDAKNPEVYALAVNQSGLGLPDRDMYLKDDAKFKELRAAYQAYITEMLTAAGYPNPAGAAKAILAFETQMAKVSWPREKRRNRDLTYNPKSLAELKAFAPGYPWDEALKAEGFTGRDRFIVAETDAVANLAALFGKTKLDTLKAYMTVHTLRSYASLLPKVYDDATFNFYGRTLNGQKQQRDRWKRGVDATSGMLGEGLGQLYVAKHFPPAAKAQMLELVENLRKAWRVRIENNAWMDPATKAEALAKLNSMRLKIGYPDTWRDYSALEIKAGDPVGNARRSALFEHERDLGRLDRPTDKDEWFMTPQTVNAYYNSIFNEIVFPAAILQAPFFDPNADAAVNYGGIGGVIGHEIGHGFDDQGSKSDSKGVLRNWWTAEDKKRFEELSAALADQYSAYAPLPGVYLNGRQTLGENSADLAGLTISFEAYKMSLGGREAPVKDGFTGEQRVFLGWAQVWRGLVRDEAQRTRVLSDVHSPPRFRAFGPVRNIDAWYAAFGVKEGDALYLPEDKRVRIW